MRLDMAGTCLQIKCQLNNETEHHKFYHCHFECSSSIRIFTRPSNIVSSSSPLTIEKNATLVDMSHAHVLHVATVAKIVVCCGYQQHCIMNYSSWWRVFFLWKMLDECSSLLFKHHGKSDISTMSSTLSWFSKVSS